MKRQMLILAIALFALAGLAQATPAAPTVLWVSECWDETQATGPHDQGFIDMLTADGYTVSRWTTALMGVDPTKIDAAAQALANTYDLIIVGRHGGSGYENDPGERELWNGITAPMIVTGAYNSRGNRWNWEEGNSSGAVGLPNPMKAQIPTDPVFAGVTLDGNDQVDVVDYATAFVRNVTATNGTLVATTTGGYAWIIRWDASKVGGAYFPTGTQIVGGPRMLFQCGRSGGGDGTLNLTAAGRLMFLNAVYEMSGATFARAPMISAGSDGIANAGVAVQLDGSAYSPAGNPMTIAWTQVSGPGIATFSDATIIDPTVTFSAKGTYTLQLEVNDGTAVTDTATFYVRDTADNTLLAHWDFESLPDPNSLPDVTGKGFDGIWYSTDGGDPNVVTGVLGQAVDLSFMDGYWEVPNTLSNVDPNFYGIQTGNTFAAWIKVDPAVTDPTGYPVIAAYDTSSARLQLQNRHAYLSIGPANVEGTRLLDDNLWHHVVGVYDGVNSTLSIYVDGVEDKDATVVAPATLCGVGLVDDPLLPDNQLRIGNRNVDRPFHGQIDDIQVYNYPLSAGEIATLTDAGNVPVYVSAGEDQLVNFKNQPVQLAGELVVDDGVPGPATVAWTLTGRPVAADPNFITINNPTALDATVSFPAVPVEGAYTFTLTADDTVTTSADTVVITINIPSCADVIADGLSSEWDLVGGPLDILGNPTPDCRVDLKDFAAMAVDWLECVDPTGGVGCTSPY